jgi:hypothetical protein
LTNNLFYAIFINVEEIRPMTKMIMANVILQFSSCKSVNAKKFEKNVNKQSKDWIERAYNMVINSESDEKKKLNADFVMQWLR